MHRQVMEHGMRPDVIGVKKPLDKYKLLITTAALTLELGDLPARIEEWVKAGGTWVVGPMTDLRTVDGTHYTDREMGMVERLTGAKLVQQAGNVNKKILCSWADGEAFEAKVWVQMYEAPADATVLATVTGDVYPALQGLAIAFSKKVGKGRSVALGAEPSDADMAKLLDGVLAESGAQHFAADANLAVAYREGDAGTGYAVVEYRGKTGKLSIDAPMTALITGETFRDAVEVAPFGVRVLKKGE